MDTLPTFSGFPQAGLEFLANLAAHNDRVWFEAHKKEYHALLLEPAQAFVMTLGAKLQALSNGIRCDTRTDGKGVLMRLHRDTRFSPDKTPYNTHISGLFWEGSQKKTERPASNNSFQPLLFSVGVMRGARSGGFFFLRVQQPRHAGRQLEGVVPPLCRGTR